MLTVAYLANQFPVAVEPYMSEEIQELRRRGVNVIPGSVRKPSAVMSRPPLSSFDSEILCLQPFRIPILLQAFGLAARRRDRISGLVKRALLHGKETPKLRLKALLHTCLGAYYAVLLQKRGVDHIHVHHGYFGSWIAMVAARLLGINFSVTLHGSDLLLHATYLDTKLDNCRFCLTISEYNRRYILEHFAEVDPRKIIVSRLGVDVPEKLAPRLARNTNRDFTLLAVGRLHPVKDHAFLIHACGLLRDSGLNYECVIAGEGPERAHLELMVREKRLQNCITLLGHVARVRMDALYSNADVVVLTSRSEGIPLVLMEAMARGGIVLAPAITGIPELVIPGKTGFLYKPGDLEDFVHRILFLRNLMIEEDHPSVGRLNWIRHAARVQIHNNFSRDKNLSHFGDLFLQLISPCNRSSPNEDLVLQQI